MNYQTQVIQVSRMVARDFSIPATDLSKDSKSGSLITELKHSLAQNNTYAVKF